MPISVYVPTDNGNVCSLRDTLCKHNAWCRVNARHLSPALTVEAFTLGRTLGLLSGIHCTQSSVIVLSLKPLLTFQVVF